MKFRFCGEADCPDWVLAEINTLSRLSSVKLKLLCQVVSYGIINPPIDMAKAEKLFSESKLDSNMDLKACVACLTFIVNSTVRFNCNSSALHSELQQLGLPREHSTSIKRVLDDQNDELTIHFQKTSLKVNPLEDFTAKVDGASNCVNINLKIGDIEEKVIMVPETVRALLENLKQAREKLVQLNENPMVLS